MEEHSGPLGVFWDIENCDVPHGKSATSVCAKVRDQEFFRGYSEVQFTVVCDVIKFTERQQRTSTILEDLERNQDGLEPDNVRRVLWQLTRAVRYCHEHSVIHRDIKPESFCFDSSGRYTHSLE